MADDVQYYIEEGVRRSVAMRELGEPIIPAVLYIEGQPPKDVYIPLSALHSPKAEIFEDDRYRDIAQKNSTALGRSWLEKTARIQVQILRADPRQKRTVPLKDVLLLPKP